MTEADNTLWSSGSDPIEIGEYSVDTQSLCISKDGESTKLEPKTMALLLYLAQRPGSVVSREELEREIWKDVVVGYDALNNTVAKLRKSFGDDTRDPQYIKTIPKVGYQLIAEVGVSPDATGVADAPVLQESASSVLERKLAAILYADVVDYSRLTGLDEEGTHLALRNGLDLMTEMIERYHGNVVNFAGDAILAEFNSASNALSCAVMVQQELEARNSDTPDERKMQFRIGVNLGEVIVDRDDIFGDGVNVAARLEGLADPGGICLSGSVFDAISHKLPLDYSFLGERQVKNIEKPVRAYRARLKPEMTLPPPATRPVRESGPGLVSRIGNKTLVASAAALLFVVFAVIWFQRWESSNSNKPTAQKSGNPSVAVLPFKNISDDPAQGFLADGITDDLITDLSQVSGVDVTSRHSAFAYKHMQLPIEEIAAELGVRYVLEGSIRRFESDVRINATLIDASNGKSIWADRYEGSREQLFDLQESVIAGIVESLEIELTASERSQLAKRPTANLEAYDYFQRAERRRLIEHRDPVGNDDNYTDAIELYRKAIELDPDFAEAYAGLAMVGFNIWLGTGTHVMPTAVARKMAYESASKVSELDPDNPQAYAILALLQATDRQYELAIASVEKAVDLDPDSALSYATLAQVLTYAGQHPQALQAIQKSFELQPDATDDQKGMLGRIRFFNNDIAGAVSAYEQVHEQFLRYRHELVMAYGEMGRIDDGNRVFEKIIKRMPFANLGYYRARYSHYKNAEDLERMIAGLRAAGVPENAYGFKESVENRLNADELEALVNNRTWNGADEQGFSFVQQFSGDGRVAFSNEYTMLVGESRLDGESICVQFPSSMLGREDCGFVYRNPDGTREERNEYVRLAVGSVYYFSAK